MSAKRSVFSAIVGNMLEFYDSSLSIVYAITFGEVFFPQTGSFCISIYRGMGVFALGVLIRPLGGLLFGSIGDIYGRKCALFLSMIMMAMPSLLIAFLPSYETIGIFAPALLIFARIIQGLCTGGEYNGAAIYALENTTHKKGLVSGFITASSVFGVVLASLVQSILQVLKIPDGFRIAFLIGTGIACFGIYVRYKLLESPEFLKIEKRVKNPLGEAWQKNKKELLIIFFVAGQLSLFGYLLLAVAPALLKLNSSFPSQLVPWLTVGSSLLFALFCIFFGNLSDYLGQKDYTPIASTLSWIVLPFTLWTYTSSSVSLILMGHALLAFLAGLQGSTQHRFYQGLFPTHLRYSAISFSFSLGTGILALLVSFLCSPSKISWIFLVFYTTLTGIIARCLSCSGQQVSCCSLLN